MKGISKVLVATIALAVIAMNGRAQNASPAEIVSFVSPTFSGKPIQLAGYLRHPEGPGPFPAVVLLHGCAGDGRDIDSRWGTRLAQWGYVALSVDSLGPRGIESVCERGDPTDHPLDAYGALAYLAAQPFVIPERVAVMGASLGGRMALYAVERGFIAESQQRKFRAAVALYPSCKAVTGAMTAPTLIMIGELDDYTPPGACHRVADRQSRMAQDKENEVPMRLIVYPGAYHAFDVPSLRIGRQFLGHWLQYNEDASGRSIEEVRSFLCETLGG